MRDIAQAEDDGIHIDAAVFKRQFFGIAFDKWNAGGDAGIKRFDFALLQHLGIDVANDYFCFSFCAPMKA